MGIPIFPFLDSLRSSSRRRSLLGGYKAHSEAVAEHRQQTLATNTAGDSYGPSIDGPLVSPDEQSQEADNNALRQRTNQGHARKTRRLSETPRESGRMPGAELAVSRRKGGLHVAAKGGVAGGGGLAKCQRVWKMVPQARDDRPTWLRQYEVSGSLSLSWCHMPNTRLVREHCNRRGLGLAGQRAFLSDVLDVKVWEHRWCTFSITLHKNGVNEETSLILVGK